jgi:hypothetical protein
MKPMLLAKDLLVFYPNLPPQPYDLHMFYMEHATTKELRAFRKTVLHSMPNIIMFSQLNVCGLDNLYNSVKFCRYDFTGKKKVMAHRVARKSKSPRSLIQDEVENRYYYRQRCKIQPRQQSCKVTVNIAAVSIFDTEPVNFLSTAYP